MSVTTTVNTIIVPPAIKVAAKRAFLRTTYQGYAGTLSTGITATGVLALLHDFNLTTAIVTAAVAVLGPPIAGAAAWLSITSSGIPADYQPTTVA